MLESVRPVTSVPSTDVGLLSAELVLLVVAAVPVVVEVVEVVDDDVVVAGAGIIPG